MPTPSPLLSNPDYVSAYIQEPSAWQYDIDPANGVSRATYNGEVIISGQSGGPFMPLSGGQMVGPLNWIATGSTAVRSAQDRSAEVRDVLDFGADRTGAADSSPAFQAALNALAGTGGKLVVPAGVYALYSTVSATLTRGVTIEGAAANSTTLNVQPGIDGIAVTLSGGAASFSAKRLSIVRLATSGAAYANTGLAVTATAGWGGGIFSDLHLFGPSGYAWATGISLIAPNFASLRDINVTGPNANNTGSGVAISIAGNAGTSAYAVDTSFDSVTTGGYSVGLQVGVWVQGIYVNNSRFIGNDYGINWLAPGTGASEWLVISNTHFNSGNAGVVVNTVGWVNIENTLTIRFATGANTWTAIDLEGCNNIALNNNNVYGNGSGTETGFILNNCTGQPATVSANAVGHINGYAVVLSGTTASATVNGNSGNGILSAAFVQDTSGTGTNLVFGNICNSSTTFGVNAPIAATSFNVGGNKVVGARIAGYGTPTGAAKLASFPGASATLAQTTAQLAQLIVDLQTHGLLGA